MTGHSFARGPGTGTNCRPAYTLVAIIASVVLLAAQGSSSSTFDRLIMGSEVAISNFHYMLAKGYYSDLSSLYTQLSETEMTYTCSSNSTCRIHRWTIRYYGTCKFVMQVWKNVSLSSADLKFELIGQNALNTPAHTYYPGITHYEDVPIEQQFSFTGTVHLGFSQIHVLNISGPRVEQCGVLMSYSKAATGFLVDNERKEDPVRCLNSTITFPHGLYYVQGHRGLVFGAFITNASANDSRFGTDIQQCIAAPGLDPLGNGTQTSLNTISASVEAPTTTEAIQPTPSAGRTSAALSSSNSSSSTGSEVSTEPSSTDAQCADRQGGGGEKDTSYLYTWLPVVLAEAVLVLLLIALLLRRSQRSRAKDDAKRFLPAVTPGYENISSVKSQKRQANDAAQPVVAYKNKSSEAFSRQDSGTSADLAMLGSPLKTSTSSNSAGFAGSNGCHTPAAVFSVSIDSRSTASTLQSSVEGSDNRTISGMSSDNQDLVFSTPSGGDNPAVVVVGAQRHAYEVVLPARAAVATRAAVYETAPTISKRVQSMATHFRSSPKQAAKSTANTKIQTSPPSHGTALAVSSTATRCLYDNARDNPKLRRGRNPADPRPYSNHEIQSYTGNGTSSSSSPVPQKHGPYNSSLGYRLPHDAIRVPNDPVCTPAQDTLLSSMASLTPRSSAKHSKRSAHGASYLKPEDEGPPTMPARSTPAPYFDLEIPANRDNSGGDGSDQRATLPAVHSVFSFSSNETTPQGNARRDSNDGCTVRAAKHDQQAGGSYPCGDGGDDSSSVELLSADPFVPPPSESTALEMQLSVQGIEQFSSHQLVCGDILGTGEFGVVRLAALQLEQTAEPKLVAVKQLRTDKASHRVVSDNCLKEALMLGQFHHPHIMQFLGVVRETDKPVKLVLELLTGGDLLSHLKALEKDRSLSDVDLFERLVQFSLDIAHGAQYLAEKNFIHRDLASRNIMLDSNLMCKISDFGMSRKLSDCDFYESSGGKVPVRWTAPEALIFKKYSVWSDVWSYGVILYEIWALGAKPYASLSPEEILEVVVAEQYRLSRPRLCPEYIYSIMRSTWLVEPHSRPMFKTLVKQLTTFIHCHHQHQHQLQLKQQDQQVQISTLQQYHRPTPEQQEQMEQSHQLELLDQHLYQQQIEVQAHPQQQGEQQQQQQQEEKFPHQAEENEGQVSTTLNTPLTACPDGITTV